MDSVYASNKRTNRNIAIALLALLLLQTLGILAQVGFNLASFTLLPGYSLLWVIQVFGILWVIYGLWKYKIGA